MAFEGTLQEFTISMHGRTLEHPYIEAQQGDTASRKVRIHLKTFGGADFLIPYGATAVLSVDKTDGHKVLNECEIEDSSTVIITLTSQTLACPGKQPSQIYIFTDKGDIKTQKFYIHVPKAVYDQDAIKSTDEYGILQDLISRIESLGANVTSENIKAALGYTPAKETEVSSLKSDLAKKNSYVVQDTEPEDTSVLWVDPNDNNDDGFQEAVQMALREAKASGEFDGKDGTNGKTPVKGEDYFTDSEKAEMVNAVIAALPVYSGEVL